MTTHYGTFALAAVLGLTCVAGTAQAQLLDGTGNGSVQVEVSSDTTTDVSTDAAVSADADASMGEDTTGGDSSTSVSGDTGMNAGSGFSLTRRSLDLSGDASATAGAESVMDEAGLRAYAESSLRSNDRFDGISVNEEGVRVTYRRDARFLGFIPSGMNVTVQVAGNGDVSVQYPWYSFLYAADESRDELETRIRSELASLNESGALVADASVNGDAAVDQNSASVSGSGSATGSATYDSQRWARIIERIETSLSAEASGTVNAQAS